MAQQLSQRDPRWASLQLGTSNTTLGTHGCLVTAIASILNTTPDVVNQRLNALPADSAGNTGFAKGNLVYWARIQEAFPGVQVRREWTYNNDDVKANLPAIVQVDGSPIGAPMHFVVYIGDHKLIDPWDGQIKETNTYTALSHAIVKGTWIRDENYREQLASQIEAVNQCQTQLKNALEQATYFQQKYEALVRDHEELKKKYDEEYKENIEISKENEAISNRSQKYAEEAYAAQHLADERKSYMGAIADSLRIKYNVEEEKEIVEQVLQEVAHLQREQQALTAPEVDQLKRIIGQFEAMGINKYLDGQGVTPVSSDFPDENLVSKIGMYLEALANELITLSDKPTAPAQSVTPQVPVTQQSPIRRSIRLPKPSVNFFSLVKRPVFFFLSFFLEQK